MATRDCNARYEYSRVERVYEPCGVVKLVWLDVAVRALGDGGGVADWIANGFS